jgi:putative membrane protein
MNQFNYSRTIRRLNRTMVASLAVFGAISCMAAHTGKADHKEAAFIKEAAQGNQAEVQMGQMGAQKAQNDQVKQLAQHLQQDHSQANQELTQIAQKLGVDVPTQPDRKETRASEKFQDKTGAEFDKAFVEHALQDHQKDITKYEKALQDVQDPQLKAFVQKSLPKLQHHLQMARTAGTAVGVDQKTLAAADRFLSEHGRQSGTSSQDQRGLGTAPGAETGRGSKGQQDSNTSSSSSSEGKQSDTSPNSPDRNQTSK